MMTDCTNEIETPEGVICLGEVTHPIQIVTPVGDPVLPPTDIMPVVPDYQPPVGTPMTTTPWVPTADSLADTGLVSVWLIPLAALLLAAGFAARLARPRF